MKILLCSLLLGVSLNASSTEFDSGQKIYEQTCLSCHGVDGGGNKAMSFIVNPRNLNLTILDQEQLYQIVKKGAHFHGAAADIMPSFESVFDERELRNVTHYIATAFNSNAKEKIKTLMDSSAKVDFTKKAKMLKRGKKIYNRNCSWCHGKDASGNGEATRNPEMSIFPYNLNKSLLTKDQMFLYIKYGGKYWGTVKEDMPSWSRKYNDDTIHSIVLYLKESLSKDNSK